MSSSPSGEQSHAMLKWLNRHRAMLIGLYPNQYVAYNEKGAIAHSKDLREVLKLAQESGEVFAIYWVPRYTGFVQILSIRFRTVSRHNWIPNYYVKLKHRDTEIEATMLVDSGADVSLIPLQVGRDLGYALADAESTLLAETIGGTVEYVMRNLEITIDRHTLVVPTAWLQTDVGVEQLLLGREVVFDKFNIEFRQAEERIIFTWR